MTPSPDEVDPADEVDHGIAPTEPGEVPFEEMVAALLQVDPEGITGQKAKRKDG